MCQNIKAKIMVNYLYCHKILDFAILKYSLFLNLHCISGCQARHFFDFALFILLNDV